MGCGERKNDQAEYGHHHGSSDILLVLIHPGLLDGGGPYVIQNFSLFIDLNKQRN